MLANRFSANPDVKVTVLEAGGWDKSPFIHMPAGYFRLMQTLQRDGGFWTVPQKHVNNRTMLVPRAKSVGGCTTVNGMIYPRPPHRLCHWAQRGNLKRVSLELGGKSPVFIFPDADLDRAISGAAEAVMLNSGQACTAGSRRMCMKTSVTA